MWAGTAVRILRPAGRILPGLAGAAAVAAGLGEIAGHVFGRGLSPWVACAVAGVFGIRIGSEINQAPPPPRPDE